MTQALLLVDIQNDYFPGGAMELVGSPEAGIQAGLLLETCRRSGLAIVHIQHLAMRPGATFFLPGTPGAEITQASCPGPVSPFSRSTSPTASGRRLCWSTCEAWASPNSWWRE